MRVCCHLAVARAVLTLIGSNVRVFHERGVAGTQIQTGGSALAWEDTGSVLPAMQMAAVFMILSMGAFRGLGTTYHDTSIAPHAVTLALAYMS